MIDEDETRKFGRIESPDHRDSFYVRWKNLSYYAEERDQLLLKKHRKRLLNGLDGHFNSGELVALMGPSGAGKTTLLECLCMKKNERQISGQLIVVGKPKLRVAVVPQYDDFLPQFTVYETIYYASRYKNLDYDISHRSIVRRVIQQLGLERCQSNRIDKCSGGQRKRVAIAQELVKRPNILLLDEPTSGLDSSSCYQTIKVLRKIIATTPHGTPLAIVITIHQPSAKVLSEFDRVYLLVSGGKLAFNGPPTKILDRLSQIGLPCPAFYNPIDHMIEVISGDYGGDKIELMITKQSVEEQIFDEKIEKISAHQLRKSILYDPCPLKKHLWIHVQRSFSQLLRDPILFALRILLHFVMAFFYASLWGYDVGKGAGCPTPNKQALSSISAIFSGNLTDDEKIDVNRINDNLVFTIYGGMFTMYAAAMIAVLTFPLDVKVLAQEYFNGWYTVPTYLAGKTIADAPIQILSIVMFCSISYTITDQPDSPYHWRYFIYLFSLMILSFLAQTQGLFVGALFMNNLSASVFMGPLTITPVFLFSGYTRRYQRTANYLKPLIKLSYFHHAIKTIYAGNYGFGRCKCDPREYSDVLTQLDYEDIESIQKSNVGFSKEQHHSTNDNVYIGKYICDETFQSLVMSDLDIENNEMYIGFAVMLGYLILLRIFVLLLVMIKVRRN